MSVRRAVVVDGAICEKKQYPKCQEILGVSRLLELERERKGERNIPRFTTQLIEQCIRTNDPVLWKAANDDIDTKDFDAYAANVVLVQNDILSSLFISCITQPAGSDHLVDMLHVFFEMIPSLTDVTMLAFSKAITTHWKAFTNVLMRTVDPTTRQLKEGMYVAIARFVDSVDISQEAIVSVIREVLKHRKLELLSIFARVNANLYAELLPDILAAAKAASATNRYAVVSLVAKIAVDTDEITEDVLPMMQLVLEKTIMDKYVDMRTVRALAFLLQKFSKDPVMQNFATIVNWQLSSKM
jgi:hypothetical protein